MRLGSPLRFGVLGAANVARGFIAGVSASHLVKVTTIASRSAAKAEAFAKETSVPQFKGSYEALLDDPDIDAVYIPHPNSLHAEWACRAMARGKHVLCEKPLSVNASEAKAMFAAARAIGVRLVEAYPYLAQPQTLVLRQLLQENAIGQLQLIRAHFGFNAVNLRADPSGAPNVRFVPSLGGGALLDTGSYAVSFMRIVAGARPSRVHAAATWESSGVDRTLVATLEFPSGLLGQMSCSFAVGFHRHAMIAGEDGVIETTYSNHPPTDGAPRVIIKRGTTIAASYEAIEVPGGNGFLAEAESFARLVADGPSEWQGATPVESVDIMLTLDAMRKSARSGIWETVGT
jgi:xylose dehydrogenase (NAD/NADP)